MATAAKSYNPGFLTDDELRQMFCVRVGELESLLETLRENTGESNQHAIVIGPRGSGKTTLLLRLALEVRSDPPLSSRLYPIVFAEESYSVGTCGEFWLECLSRLSQQVSSRPGEPDLRRTVKDVRRERDDRMLRERCLGALLDFAEREDKRLVLHVENLNMLFSEMMDRDAGWCLRKTLQTEPRIMMIGSATSRFGEIDRPDRALYDLFRVLQLRPLDRKESAVLCENVSGRTVDPGVVRRLQILTGGSPRLLAILVRFAAARSFRTLLADLLDLVDEHTAYFKGHLESLAAQERRVYLALAELWKPATAREVADCARLETSKCSAQLRRLMSRGVVSPAGGTHRRREYYVSERLYNIYHLLRRSRGRDSLVAALVQFMDAYYSRSELQGVVDEMVAVLDSVDSHTRLFYQSAFEQLSALPEVAWHLYWRHPAHLPDHVRTVTERASLLLEQARAKHEDGDLAGELNDLDGLLQEFDGQETPTVRDTVAKAWLITGTVLMDLDRGNEAIIAYDKAIGIFTSIDSPEIRDALPIALVGKSQCLKGAGRMPDAIAVCDELITEFGDCRTDTVAESVAIAMFDRATMLTQLGRTDEALAGYDDLFRRFSSHMSETVLVRVANGLFNQAATLFQSQRWDEALQVCGTLWDRFGKRASTELLQTAARGMAIKIVILGEQGHVAEVLAVGRELLGRLDVHEQRALADEVADYDSGALLSLRLATHEIRMLALTKAENDAALVEETRVVLGILPRIATIPARTIQCLMVASIGLGIEQMALLIRESPSADRLLALTTALDLEMGDEPRVAKEIRDVAHDLQLELAEMRAQAGMGQMQAGTRSA